MDNYYIISYGLTIIAFLITLGAQGFVFSTYNKYKKRGISSQITGSEAARKILDKNDLQDIRVEETVGMLTDHYDPMNKVIRLSSENYNGASIAGIAVACHECGHAIQDKNNYGPLRLRHALIPFVNFASYAGYFAILIGIFFSSINLIWLGILAEIVILIFQLITLPVEFDASRRALKEIEKLGIFNSEEMSGGREVLTAAALTYVASVAAAILEILRLILIFGKREDD